jgi:hypothetical protein
MKLFRKKQEGVVTRRGVRIRRLRIIKEKYNNFGINRLGNRDNLNNNIRKV